MITLDTSGLIATLSTRDRFHQSVRAIVASDPGPRLIPVGTLAEITFMIERDFRPAVEVDFLQDLIDGAYTPYWDVGDLPRIRDLVVRYADLRLGFADAAVIACAERHGGRLLSIDRRHLTVVARGEGTITVLPEL